MTDALSDPRQARDRVQRIRMGLETLASLQTDIADAYQAQDWHTLGYDSWSSYVESEFVGVQLRLPKDERRELVGSLREAGMSTRAIAATTGVHHSTVAEDVRGVGNPTPESPPVTGLDGKTYTPQEPEPEPVEAELVDEPAPQAPARKPRRKPITDQACDVAVDGRKWADRLARILSDDRASKNAEQVDTALRGDLLHVRDTVTEALERLDD